MWVMSLGGAVRVDNKTRDTRDQADLPKGRFTVTMVDKVVSVARLASHVL